MTKFISTSTATSTPGSYCAEFNTVTLAPCSHTDRGSNFGVISGVIDDSSDLVTIWFAGVCIVVMSPVCCRDLL